MRDPAPILFTIPNFITAGSGRAMVNVASRLDRARFSPSVAVLRRGGSLEAELERLGIPLIEAAFTVPPRPLATLPWRAWTAAQPFRERGFVLWHSYHYLDDYTEPIVARLAGARSWIYTKKNMSWNHRSWWIRTFLARRVAAMNTDMLEHYFSPPRFRRKSVLLPPGVETEMYRPGIPPRLELRTRLGTPAGTPVIGCVANLVPIKGHPVLIEAMARVPGARLWLAGAEHDANYADALRRRIAELGLEERVSFVGSVSDIPAFLAEIDVFVLPTQTGEGLGVALLEAMSSGVASVAFEIPGPRDVVESGRNGWLVPAGDVGALAGVLRKLAEDGELRRRLGSEARRRVLERYSIEREVAGYEALYSELIPDRWREERRVKERRIGVVAAAEGDTLPAGLETVGCCGDLLLTFGVPAATLSGRFRDAGGWRSSHGLWLTPPGEKWRGFPMREFEAEGWRLWLVGELALPAGTDAAVWLGEIATGRKPGRSLNGHLLLLGRCRADGRWHVWTDRFGTVHAYLGSTGSHRALGTSFAAVASAASERRLDWPALSAFFACGFFPADRTFFDDVRVLRPASHLVFSASGELLSEERYWDWRHAPSRTRSYDDTVAEFAATFHEVLDDETVSGRIAVPISGGLDSRSTFAALTRDRVPARERLWCYSYGYSEDSIETRIARRVAEARKMPIETRSVGPYLFDRLPAVLGCIEGFQDLTQARQAVMAERLAERSDAVIAAHWGDVWLDDMGLAGRMDVDPAMVSAHAFHKVAKKGREWLLAEVAGPRLPGEDPEAIAQTFVDQELERLGMIAEPDFRVKAFKTEQWSFRWTLASLRMFQAGAYPRLPFYDTRMTDFFATVPTDFVAGRRLQIDYLKRYAPDLARITWQKFGTDLYWHRHFETWLLPWRAARKAARLARGGPEAPQRNWEVQFSGSGREPLRRALLAPGSRVHELVDRGRIERLLEEFLTSPLEKGRGYTVSMLLTFSEWLNAHG